MNDSSQKGQLAAPYRKAELIDAARIGRMLRRFYQKDGGIFQIEWDHESVLQTILRVMEHGVCIVGPRSCAGALFGPFPYNHNYTIAHVVFWYFTSAREIKILDALAQACGEAGATHLNPSSVWPSNTIGRYYEKAGLHACETQWLGKIACILPKRE